MINAQAAAELNTAKVQELEASAGSGRSSRARPTDQGQQSQVAADRASLPDATWKLQQKEIASPRAAWYSILCIAWVSGFAEAIPLSQLLPPENLEIRFLCPQKRSLGNLRVGQSIRVNCDGCSANTGSTITFIWSPQNEYTPPVHLQQRKSLEALRVFMVIAEAVCCKAHPICIPDSLWRFFTLP